MPLTQLFVRKKTFKPDSERLYASVAASFTRQVCSQSDFD